VEGINEVACQQPADGRFLCVNGVLDVCRPMAYNSINKEGYAVQETTAILSHELLDDHQYTVFAFGGVVLRFRAPDCLQAYTEVKEWDNGYLVVMAKYSHKEQPIEEYIDLLPILENLRMDAQGFLTPIKEVEISNE
jgi:hypothetical protein